MEIGKEILTRRKEGEQVKVLEVFDIDGETIIG
jgi:hypothetical protein